MTKLAISPTIDTVMLVAFAALQSWRPTGVPIHEWLGLLGAGRKVLRLRLE